ncbi:MAG: DNA/RNA nuclease SfsA [Deltaproteobacteria bacterium]|nr:DNA/RNA nuclease SfsA [Deltaproteobacteria bacterium]
MRYPWPLVEATLTRRYKRFLCDGLFDDGAPFTAHCANPGRMTSAFAEGARARLSLRDDPKRKLRWTVEQIRIGEAWVMVNTALANQVVAEGISAGLVPELGGYEHLLTEQRYGERSRVDLLLLRGGALPPGAPPRRGATTATAAAYVEVKSVTLREGARALFPDAVTARGARHMEELAGMVRAGHRAVVFFLVSRDDVSQAGVADAIDPAYGAALRAAVAEGVEVLAWQSEVAAEGLSLGRSLPFVLPP